MPKINPQGIEELPEQSAAKFDKIADGAVPFLGHRMPINIYVVENFVTLRITLAAGTQYGDLVAVLAQGEGFFPHAGIEGDGQVFDDNQDLIFHVDDLF
jgi:hypothetical protein